MEKNKNNRTDLLAAGRKKLQQYRQKKDGKGSKSSGKANKPDRDVVTGDSSSVAKPPPVQESSTELVEISSQGSMDTSVATNADVATPDPSSTSSVPIESSKVADSVDDLVPIKDLQSSSLDDVIPVVSPPKTVQNEGKHEGGLSVGLRAVLDDSYTHKAGDLIAAHGEDQVPDENDHSSLEPDNRTSLIDVDEDAKRDYNADEQSLSGIPSSDHEPGIGDSGDTNVDVQSASGILSSDHETAIGDSSDTNADVRPDSGLPSSGHELAIGDSGNADVHIASGLYSSSDYEPKIADSGVNNADEQTLSGLQSSDHESVICDSGDTNTDVHATSGLHSSFDHEPRIGDSGVTNADEYSLSGLLSADHEPTIADSGDTNADVRSASEISTDHEPRIGDSGVNNADEQSLSGLPSSDHESVILDSGDTNADVVDIHMKSGSAEFPEKLKEQLYMNNFEKELVYLQLHEERDVRKNFEQDHLQWVDEKSSFTATIGDLESKNKTLSEELTKCRSELDVFADKMEELEMSVSFSKTELDWSSSRIQELQIEVSNVSSELVDSKSLVSDLQSKNETLNVNLATLSQEKEVYVLENEKLVKELSECKSLLQSVQVENVNFKESIDLVMEERAKLEELKQKYVSENEKLLTDWKKLDEVLASEREERSKHKEANEHFIQENNKVSMELLESKKLMDSLQLEIANLSENLDLVTKERNKLGEDLDHSRLEKEEFLTELTTCKTLLKNLQVEYEKAMNESRDSTLQLEQLTRENISLNSNVDMYKSKITELDDWKIKSEQRASHTEAMKEKNNDLEEIFLKNVILDEFMKQYVSTIEAKKGELVDLCEELRQEAVITKRTNSELTEKLHNFESRIQDLQEKLEDAGRAHNLLSESYKDMTEKTKDLESANEQAAYVIHKVFDNLQKLVNNSGPTTESEDDSRSGQLDQLEISNYDVFIERLIMLLHEHSQLEVKNREYNLELLRRIKDLEELNKKFNNPDIALLGEKLKSKEFQINQLAFSIASYELESFIFKESLKTSMEQTVVFQSESKTSENRVSALREKLHIAVTKGKGLIQQRDTLKQNLTMKDAAIQELEAKLKSYSEAGERMEALESELSYIRNSATALRESFLLKDSVLQRIEEILEDLDLPEHFHDRDVIDKIDWLAKSVSHGPSQAGVIERAHSYPGGMDGWKEDLEPVSDELRRNYDELQNKFYELAEQNEMLEQSLMERNNLVQRCEEVLEKTNMPLHLRSLEPEDKIDWLRVVLEEANDRCALLEQSLMAKNSLVQSCEEVLEKTNMPPNVQSLEPEAKIDWLRVVLVEANDRCALLEQSLMEKSSFVQKCEEVLEKTNMPSNVRSLEPVAKVDWLRVALEEANDRYALLEQSLMEKNSLVQRCEEVLKKTNMPSHARSLEPEAKIDWLRVALEEANDRCALLEQSLMEKSSFVQKCEEVLEKTNMPLNVRSLEPEAKVDWLRVALEEANDRYALLEQSLMEKNSLVQRCEEVLEKTNMPSNVRLLEPVAKVDWLRVALEEANDRYALHEQSLVEKSSFVQKCEEVLEKTNMPSNVRSLEPEAKVDWLRVALEEANDRCALLEQSLMEKSSFVQKCEEVLEKTNMPLHVQSLEPEAKINWLRVALEEANDRCALHQQDLEKIRVSLSADLEESHGRLHDLESNLKSTTDEKEQILARFEAQSHDYNKIFEKVGLYEIEKEKLKNEIGALQLKLDEKRVDEEHIKRLQDLVKDMLQDPEKENLDSSMNDIEFLEGLLRKLGDKYQKYPSGVRSVEELEVLERKLEEVEDDLEQVKAERDKHMEKSQTLVNEVEVLEIKNHELQKLHAQEEQKTGVVREKLNVAVRKGKSLVQQRDTMKQTINELTADVARLTSETKARENTLLGYQEKMKDLFTLQELVENKDSEIRFLKNRLEEILGALGEIDVGAESKTNDPIEKLEQIEKKCRDLQDGILSAEQDSRKSKRAAELLLEELNEVQDRNEDLLEEISKVSKEKDLAEAATRDSLSHLEQLSAVHMEERSSQFEELMKLKSGLEDLKPELSKIYNLVNDVLPKDLDRFYNLESSVESLLESSDDVNRSHGGITSRKDSKDNLDSRLFLNNQREEEQHSDNEITDLWRFVGTHMEDLTTNITLLEEKLQSHSKSLHKESLNLSKTLSTLQKEITSNKHSLESTIKQKETENLTLSKYISMLYEACKNSVFEIEKVKGQPASNDDMESSVFIEGETLSVSEERIVNMANRLLSLLRDFNSFQAENKEMDLKEMKERISSLQKELTEKDVQKDRICVDLVSQIKRAEAAAMNNLQELESAKDYINDLKGQLEAVNMECNALKQRVKEVEEDQESVLADLQEKVKSLTHALTAKEQEAEALLQALDEEEAQMEDLTNKITELEKLIQQKTLDLENTEAARGKALKKLSITVKKFDELHHLSETLVSEVDNLQSQLQERDSEISFLRDEITRCTSDSLQALESDKKSLDGIQDILTWLESQDLNLDDNNNSSDQVHEYKETLKRQITSIVSELKDLRQLAQSKDDLLHIERSKVEDLINRREILENTLKDQETRLSLHQDDGDSARAASMTSEIVEVEPVINKWQPKGTSMATQVRSLRKVNNDQLAISIDDMDSDEKDKLEDEDDDKAHGFKSLTTSKLVPKFTRPLTNFVDGLWVSCDRALQRQPVLRLSLILYWALMHALLAAFVV